MKERYSGAFGLAMATGLVLLGCSGNDGREHSRNEVRVVELSKSDTILVTDLIGSLLGEADGEGVRTSSVAMYPYGLERYDDSSETNKYADNPRDQLVGLDHMGSRFYSPELGVWTSGDPLAVLGADNYATAEFGAANPYAYANLRPTIAADRNGQFWHIAVGAAAGALIGGGLEAARQYATKGKVEDWGRVGAATGGGAISGAIATSNPAAALSTVLSLGATSGAAGGMAERLISSGGKDAGTVTDVVVDATIGMTTAGIVKGGSSLLKKMKPKPAAKPSASQPTSPTRSTPQAGPGAGEFGSGDVAFGLTRANGNSGALVDFAGDAQLGTWAPLSQATREMPSGAARNGAIADETLGFARSTLEASGGRLRFNLTGFDVRQAVTPGSDGFSSVTSAEFRGVLGDPALSSQTDFFQGGINLTAEVVLGN